MPFGKYKGEELEDIPVSYLIWVLENVDLFDPDLRDEMEDITGVEASAPKRTAEERSKWKKKASGESTYTPPPPPPPTRVNSDRLRRELIDSANRLRRSLAGKFHPDRGNDPIILKEINNGIDKLMKDIDTSLSLL